MLVLLSQVSVEYHRHAANQEPGAWRHGDRVRRDLDQVIFGQRLERFELCCEILVEHDRAGVFAFGKMSPAPRILAYWDWFALIPIKHGAGRNAMFYALPEHIVPTCRYACGHIG
jgi:hypothetical protein